MLEHCDLHAVAGAFKQAGVGHDLNEARFKLNGSGEGLGSLERVLQTRDEAFTAFLCLT